MSSKNIFQGRKLSTPPPDNLFLKTPWRIIRFVQHSSSKDEGSLLVPSMSLCICLFCVVGEYLQLLGRGGFFFS
jgi:hypothetical protein